MFRTWKRYSWFRVLRWWNTSQPVVKIISDTILSRSLRMIELHRVQRLHTGIASFKRNQICVSVPSATATWTCHVDPLVDQISALPIAHIKVLRRMKKFLLNSNNGWTLQAYLKPQLIQVILSNKAVLFRVVRTNLMHLFCNGTSSLVLPKYVSWLNLRSAIGGSDSFCRCFCGLSWVVIIRFTTYYLPWAPPHELLIWNAPWYALLKGRSLRAQTLPTPLIQCSHPLAAEILPREFIPIPWTNMNFF